jgi:hypothetical protein
MSIFGCNLPILRAREPAQLGKLVFGVLSTIGSAHAGVNGRSHNAAPVWIESFSENNRAGT